MPRREIKPRGEYINNLRILMATQNIDNITELSERTGLSRRPLTTLWKHTKGAKDSGGVTTDINTVKLGTLVAICDALNIKLSELIEYDPKK